jgi:glycosyltransferase involved in cell wall biosynthesis
VLTQDPRYGGGQHSLTEAFWAAATALGAEPHLHYASRADGLSPRLRPRLRPREERHGRLAGTAYPSFLPELDAVNQAATGARVARRIRAARQAWVVAGSAPYGAGAPLSSRPYGCWLATGLAWEWESRQAALPRSRRLALAASRPGLLRLEREVLRRAAVVFGISPASSRSLAEAGGLPPESVATLAIPVDLDRFTPLPDDKWAAGLDPPTIAFVGRAADPRKNVPLLVAAFAELRRSHPDARLRFVGEPPLTAGPGSEATGPVESVAAALRDAAVLVLPSLQEGFGIVVAEAFACGVPAVVTPSGGPEELVRASGGGVVLSGFSVEELAATLAELLDDRDRLLELRRRGQEYVAREHSFERLEARLGQAMAAIE